MKSRISVVGAKNTSGAPPTPPAGMEVLCGGRQHGMSRNSDEAGWVFYCSPTSQTLGVKGSEVGNGTASAGQKM